jgi:endonuclease/exonuclease/phosphatase family metal-dependent hydrolase
MVCDGVRPMSGSFSKWRRRLARSALLVGALLLLLFCACGLWPAAPELGTTDAVPLAEPPEQIRVMAWNIEKAQAFTSGRSFAGSDEVRARLDRMAGFLRAHDPHLVMLSEILRACPPCPVDQVQHLARATGMHAWAFGANYRFGLPLLAIVAGNAILSRFPLRGEGLVQLLGGGPFFAPTNNRRLLLASAHLGDVWLGLGSVRNDSFDLANNLAQARQILDLLTDGPVLLAGDFNAPAGSEPMQAFQRSGRFVAAWNGPETWPDDAPRQCIDYILAPAGWELREHRVLQTGLSDHRAVLGVFRRRPR